jgi:hypothetical protein
MTSSASDPAGRGADPSLSVQAFASHPGTPSTAADLVEIKAWATTTLGAVEHWQSKLTIDLKDPLELEQVNPLREALLPLITEVAEYLFEDNARLKAADPGAWQGIRRNWHEIKMGLESAQLDITGYRDWLVQLKKYQNQISDPMEIRKMARQMRADTDEIVGDYESFARPLIVTLKEVINL